MNFDDYIYDVELNQFVKREQPKDNGMSLFKDNTSYFGTHYWWDADDNEYVFCATWKFEKGYDIPDSWHLQAVEIESYNGKRDVLVTEVEKGDNIWNDIEKEGCPLENMKEVD